MVLITTHLNVDFDALASMVAASKLNPGSIMMSPGGFSKEVSRFQTFYRHCFPVKKEKDIDFSSVTQIIIVDAMMKVLTPQLKKIIEEKKIKTTVYDHHFREEKIGGENVEYIKTAYGACTTYFVEEIIHKGLEISPEEALLFLLGIYSDTGRFTYPNTTANDMKAAAYLMSKKINMKEFADFLNDSFDTNQIKLLNRLIKNAQSYDIKGHKIIVSFAKFTEHIEQLSDVTGQLIGILGADAIASVVQMENKIFLVLRSSGDKIDVTKISSAFGGGGHRNAAAAVIPVKKGISIKAIKEKTYELFAECVKERHTVVDIMSTPVRAISPEITLEEAYKVCIRFNNNGLPVVKDDRLVGFITKGDIEKGIQHNLGQIPVKGYMSGNVAVITEDSSITEAQKIMLKNNIGHLPVVRGEKLVGIITRTDILSYLYKERPVKKEKIVFREADINIKELMLEKIDRETYSLIIQTGALADEFGVNAYLVGGIVRDLFLREKDMDIDITVEGDGMEFAKFIAEKLQGSYKGFERFKTAKVFLKNGKRIDVTSARAEFYEYPAALPQIEFTPIRYDMFRRDFTINAMAVKINRKGFGDFIDYFDGYSDLKNKIIRTLYNMSFIDDPTRILRAVRFEQRYGFEIEKNTLRFIIETLKYNIFDSLPGERIRDELLISLEEEEPYKVYKRMQELEILVKISKHFRLNERTENIYQAARRLVKEKRIPEKYVQVLYLMIFLYNVPLEETEILCDKLKFKSDIKESLVAGKKDEKKVFLALHSKSVSNSGIYNLLKPYTDETLYFFMAACGSDYVTNRIEHFMENLRNVRAHITGRDLKNLGIKAGPEFGELLNSVLMAKLDGRIKNHIEEIEFIKKALEKSRKKRK